MSDINLGTIEKWNDVYRIDWVYIFITMLYYSDIEWNI